jgi:hypothetical protein
MLLFGKVVVSVKMLLEIISECLGRGRTDKWHS